MLKTPLAHPFTCFVLVLLLLGSLSSPTFVAAHGSEYDEDHGAISDVIVDSSDVDYVDRSDSVVAVATEGGAAKNLEVKVPSSGNRSSVSLTHAGGGFVDTVLSHIRKLRKLAQGIVEFPMTVGDKTYVIDFKNVNKKQLKQYRSTCGNEEYEVYVYITAKTSGLHARPVNEDLIPTCPLMNFFSLVKNPKIKPWDGQPMKKQTVRIMNTEAPPPDFEESYLTYIGVYKFRQVVKAFRTCNVNAKGYRRYNFANNNHADFIINMLKALKVTLNRNDTRKVRDMVLKIFASAGVDGLGEKMIQAGFDGATKKQKKNPGRYEDKIVERVVERRTSILYGN